MALSVPSLRLPSQRCTHVERVGASILAFGYLSGYVAGMWSEVEGPSESFGAPKPGEFWNEAKGGPPGLRVWFRLSSNAEGGPLLLTGLHVVREGGELSARDLRQVQIGHLARAMGRMWTITDDPNTPAKPARPGPPGHKIEHWRQVWSLYEQAKRSGTRAHIKYMQAQWQPPVPDATLRRWVQTARDKHERGEL